jgi:hypothetical protein
LLGAAPLAAQRITGRVLTAESRAPIELATVTLLTGEGKSLRANATTDSTGAFTLYLPGAGQFRLQVARLGFKPARTDVIDVPSPELVTVEIALAATAAALAPIEITARERVAPGLLDGFQYRRQRDLGGTFLTREQIEQRNAYHFTHLLGGMAGVTVEQTADGFPLVRMLRAVGSGRDGYCPVVFYVDGVKVVKPARGTFTGGNGRNGGVPEMIREQLETVYRIPPSQIEGIEVYKGPSQTPGEFAGSDAECGVVVVWTRRGP